MIKRKHSRGNTLTSIGSFDLYSLTSQASTACVSPKKTMRSTKKASHKVIRSVTCLEVAPMKRELSAIRSGEDEYIEEDSVLLEFAGLMKAVTTPPPRQPKASLSSKFVRVRPVLTVEKGKSQGVTRLRRFI